VRLSFPYCRFYFCLVFLDNEVHLLSYCLLVSSFVPCSAIADRGFRSAAIQAVKAATRRSMQLGGTSEEEIKSKYNL